MTVEGLMIFVLKDNTLVMPFLKNIFLQIEKSFGPRAFEFIPVIFFWRVSCCSSI